MGALVNTPGAWGGAKGAPPALFYYKDALGECQGPCPSSKLVEWHQVGCVCDLLVCVCVCVCVHVCIHIYVCTYTRICVCVCMHV
jgi:hypothetical protein